MEEAGAGGDCNGGNPAAWMGRGGQGRQPAAPFSLNGFLYCPKYVLYLLCGASRVLQITRELQLSLC